MKAMLIVFLLFFFLQSYSQVIISEFQSANSSTIADELGDYDDWIEIHNPTDSAVNIGGMVLKNNAHIWGIPTGGPSTLIPSGEYFFIWADHEEAEGIFHANFRLSTSETLIICKSDSSTVIDSTSVPDLPDDTSYGRCPDGTWQVFSTPSPNQPNVCGTTATSRLQEEIILVYPTRVQDKLSIQLPDYLKGKTSLKLVSISGNTLIERPFAKEKITLNLEDYPAGVYILLIETDSAVWKGKIIVSD